MASEQPQTTQEGSIAFQHFQETASTHSWVDANYEKLDPGLLTCVSADHQTGGRGTSGRRWVCPPGCGALCTFYFTFPSSFRAQWGGISSMFWAWI